MTNVASSGVNYWEIFFSFFPPQCSFFCLFHFSSCSVPPLRCSLYWNSNGSRVCVASKSRNWTHLPLSACGTKPWPHSSTVVKRFCYVPLNPFLFLFLPSSLDNPPPPPPTFSLCEYILYWNWCSKFPLGWWPSGVYLAYLVLRSMTQQIYVPHKKSICKGSWWSFGGTLSVVPDWSVYGLQCTVLRCWIFHPRFNVWYVWVESSPVIYCL